ncbi:MAG TPA: DUF362 domain-containing protein [Chitinispirillaceae bacterium]|nr:DUF362 domain-containing protein [Chitinispirillaceae bacterium]
MEKCNKKGSALLGYFDKKTASDEIKKKILESPYLDFLSKGDSVFIKLSSNSTRPHPAVTSPAAIEIIVNTLKEAGAGEIIIGDQAGVQYARLTQQGRKSSTRDVFSKNGILQEILNSKSKIHCFDDHGWNSYFSPKIDFQSYWVKELYLPKIIHDVDHLIYLPRLSSHCYSGYSGGLKNAVGFLRDDSRLALHRDGENFHKRIAEINYVQEIRSKLRLTLTIADKALLHFGPDMGKVLEINKTVIIASDNLIHHDYLSTALLNWYNKKSNSLFKIAPLFHFPKSMNWNYMIVNDLWGKQERQKTTAISPFKLDDALECHPTLSHYCNISGFHPSKLNTVVPTKLDNALETYLSEFGNGRFTFCSQG